MATAHLRNVSVLPFTYFHNPLPITTALLPPFTYCHPVPLPFSYWLPFATATLYLSTVNCNVAVKGAFEHFVLHV